MSDARLIAKGRIDDLSKGFDLPNNTPFSLYIHSKNGLGESPLFIPCRLICDKEFGLFPVPVGDWNPGKFAALAPGSIDLRLYDVYWGASDNPYK